MDRSKEEAEASSALDVTEELKQQVSLASDLLAEQRWARAGEVGLEEIRGLYAADELASRSADYARTKCQHSYEANL